MDNYQRVLYILQIIGAGLATLGSVWAIVVGIWRYVKSVKKTYEAVATLTQNVSALQDTVNTLVREIKPNGGSSIKDALNRIENEVKYMKFVSSTHFDQLVETPMFTADGNGIYTWVNRACCEFYERHPGDLLGTAWEILIEQRERSSVRDEWVRAIKEERPFDMSYTVVTTDGNPRRVRCKAFGTKATGWIGFLYEEKLP